MKLTVVGCGDAFGSGGRLNTCFHVDLGPSRLLIDCGASAMIGMNRLRLDPNEVEAILISHLHGDHFGGLVWWLLHAQHVARRVAPLTIVGPPTIEQRFVTAAEALFPGATRVERRYDLRFVEIHAGQPVDIAGVHVEAFEVTHPSGAPSHALRIVHGDMVLAYSGDTEWTESLIPCGRGADLFVMECYALEAGARYHMSWRTIEAQLPRLDAKRILLTHMSEAMLAASRAIDVPRLILAEDGLLIDV